jgi:hypothetical protein
MKFNHFKTQEKKMKKIMMLMMVALLMLGLSGQAMAFFEEGHLIRIVSNLNSGLGYEYATDLGDFTGLYTPITSNNNLVGTDTFGLSNLNAADWSQVRIAYFIYSFTGENNLGGAWTSGALANSGVATLNGAVSFFNATVVPTQYWNSIGTTSVQNTQGNPNSYYNSAGISGDFQGFLNAITYLGAEVAPASGFASLGYVDQYLYYYGADPSAGGQGTPLAKIRTFANGTTQLLALAAPAVPIPAAAYLFGSGLLGLFGLRRKMAA